MVFSTTNLFKDIHCPYGEQCRLTNCIFSHELRPQETQEAEAAQETSTSANESSRTNPPETQDEPPLKRRRITYEKATDKPPSRAEQIRSELAASRTSPVKNSNPTPDATQAAASERPLNSLPSLTKSVSPPPTNGRVTSQSLQIKTNNSRSDNNKLDNSNAAHVQGRNVAHDNELKEQLNPRLIANDPAGHSKRTLFLKHLHGEMARLNQKVSDSQGLEYKQLLHLTEQELIKLALDEEEKVARDQPLVYANIIKNRVAFYKKMTVDDWIKQVKTTFEKDKPKPTVKDAKPIVTELTSQEELVVLPHLVADQTNLAPHGYVTTPPTEAQAAEAAAAVAASKNYELCDRCGARFQVFPERNAEGQLTSNGPCKHHPNRKVFPPKTRGDTVSGFSKDPYHPCCGNAVGSLGCTVSEDHVFKSSSPARLAAVLPFITTPENEEPADDTDGEEVDAVSFDCEMGYTVYGMELIRITAVSWPQSKELLDVLVRPLGAVIDLNGRFSGVWPEHFAKAIPYDDWRTGTALTSATNGTAAPDSNSSLPIVDSPQKARELLCSFLTPTTPLIGHAIDNDLNAVRLCHPTIVDTVLLFPHPRGLPMRFGLKMLSSKHLGRSIQTGGDRGHDSLEDARATGDLVRYKIGEKWKLLRATGWQLVHGELVPPPPQEYEGTLAKDMVSRVFEGKTAGKKRKKSGPGSGNSTEDEKVPLANGVAAYLQRSKDEEQKEPEIGRDVD